VQRCKGEIGRMARMIENELELSKATHGHVPSDPVPLRGLVDAVVGDLRPRLEELGAEVVVEPLPEVFADPDQTRQVFGNLIENALKYRRPEVPLVVRVAEERRPDLDGLCEISI